MATAYERPEGVTDAEWRQFFREIEEAEAALRDRVCPICYSALSKTLDPDQTGDSSTPGLWFNYRCTNPICDFLADQKEAN